MVIACTVHDQKLKLKLSKLRLKNFELKICTSESSENTDFFSLKVAFVSL